MTQARRFLAPQPSWLMRIEMELRMISITVGLMMRCKEQLTGQLAFYGQTKQESGGVRVLVTGPQGFERAVLFALDEDPVVITERVRETIDE
jgi:hypothetical protein